MSRRCILITGASAGIGKAFAHRYARAGWDIIPTARREGPLRALSETLARDYGITADLAHEGAVTGLLREIETAGLQVDGLINNAGFSRTEGFLRTEPEAQQAMIRVMLTVPIDLSRALVPGMKTRGFGRVINVASLAGQMPATGGDTLYGPIKSFLIKASQGLWLELQDTGVHVTALCPGYTLTEFHDVNGTREEVSSAYPKCMWQSADRVADVGYRACEANRPKVTPGFMNNVMAGLAKYLPDALALRLVSGHARRLKRL